MKLTFGVFQFNQRNPYLPPTHHPLFLFLGLYLPPTHPPWGEEIYAKMGGGSGGVGGWGVGIPLVELQNAKFPSRVL